MALLQPVTVKRLIVWRLSGAAVASDSKEALCVAAKWRCCSAPLRQSHVIVQRHHSMQRATQTVPCYYVASPQPTDADPAVFESLRPCSALSDPGSEGVLMGKAS